MYRNQSNKKQFPSPGNKYLQIHNIVVHKLKFFIQNRNYYYCWLPLCLNWLATLRNASISREDSWSENSWASWGLTLISVTWSLCLGVCLWASKESVIWDWSDWMGDGGGLDLKLLLEGKSSDTGTTAAAGRFLEILKFYFCDEI